MKVKIKVEQEVDLKTLHVEAGVRYWEDALVNGIEDVNGDFMPCREGDLWKPIINLETGRIINWKTGTRADIHYKVCDAGSYFLKDAEGKTILSIINDYVPAVLCPEEEGYGDYIIMFVDETGLIKNWEADLTSFIEEED